MNANIKALAPSPLSTSPAKLKVIKGPYKGVVYKLVAGKITLGRSSENDISLTKDDKVSRKQALLKLEKSGHWTIKDLSNRASLKVNNMVKLQSDLQDGDIIQCGATVLQMSAPPLPVPPPAGPQLQNPPALGVVPAPSPIANPAGDLAPAPLADPLSLNPSIDLASPPLEQANPHPVDEFSQPINKKKKQNNKKLRFRIIIASLVLVALYLFFSDSNPQKVEQEDKLKTQIEREQNIQTLQELEQSETKKRKENTLMAYKHAQFAYIKGMRDYRKGVYNRAVESFRACKTMYPQHSHCGAYLEKAKSKSQQLIQAWMIAGKAYREKRRFAPCMSSFKNVMTAIRDKNNLTYKEAYENYKICKLQYEDRY